MNIIISTLLILVSIIVITALLTESLAAKGIIHKEIARKILHLTAGVCAALSLTFEGVEIFLYSAGILAAIFNFIAVRKNIFKGIHNGNRKSFGIFYLPLSFIFLVYIRQFFPSEAFYAMLILALSDSLAALAGLFIPGKKFNLTGDVKSFPGSSAFFITTFLILFIGNISQGVNSVFIHYNESEKIIAFFSIGIILTAFEAISSRGTDNLTVPVASVFLLIVFANGQAGLPLNFFTGIFLSAIVATISFRVGFLTSDGSVATFLLAGFIFGLGGWKWSMPILTFFILSSLLSKFRKKRNQKVELYFEKTGTRDWLQVAANGGLGGVIICFAQIYPGDFWYLIYIASLAAVCADTWGTEIGTLWKTKTISVLNFRVVEQGVSGGISLPGTLGVLTGAFIVALSGLHWSTMPAGPYLLLMLFSGVLGSFFDSVLGATLQVQYKCNVCGKQTEREIHCSDRTMQSSGISWINNDVVNLLAGICGSIAVGLIIL